MQDTVNAGNQIEGKKGLVMPNVLAVYRWLCGISITSKLIFAGMVLLYLPATIDTAKTWLVDENNAHGVFIWPIVMVLLWLERQRINQVTGHRQPLGLLLLGVGVFINVTGGLVQLGYIGYWSMVISIAGIVIALKGIEYWKKIQFPICFALFAGAIPGAFINKISGWLQTASTVIASETMNMIGVSVSYVGNLIDVPGARLEVADVCSGFKKTVALVAFALLYGYVYRLSSWRRALLVILAIPIALIANVIRISGLIAVASYGGESALHVAHDWAEFAVLIIAFFIFVAIGKLLGCKTLRYSDN